HDALPILSESNQRRFIDSHSVCTQSESLRRISTVSCPCRRDEAHFSEYLPLAQCLPRPRDSRDDRNPAIVEQALWPRDSRSLQALEDQTVGPDAYRGFDLVLNPCPWAAHKDGDLNSPPSSEIPYEAVQRIDSRPKLEVELNCFCLEGGDEPRCTLSDWHLVDHSVSELPLVAIHPAFQGDRRVCQTTPPRKFQPRPVLQSR